MSYHLKEKLPHETLNIPACFGDPTQALAARNEYGLPPSA
jgi:hypothetical protein